MVDAGGAGLTERLTECATCGRIDAHVQEPATFDRASLICRKLPVRAVSNGSVDIRRRSRVE
jgi:hypothetical protein